VSGSPVSIDRLDHLVLTVRDIDAACAFYERALGMRRVTFAAGGGERTALGFGRQKINLHLAGREFEPKARIATPGSADLCFITATPLDAVRRHIESLGGITIEEGPVPRTGATGPLLSIYLRDPDGNLIEISNEDGAG
jgi:catechol 2,3-dioxygenase-like lactoylglutathione lyase family enzyme